MDIRNWPINKVMQLPDWCFGRRWPVSVAVTLTGAAAVFDRSDPQLPDRFVVWEVVVMMPWTASCSIEVALATGIELPPNTATFDQLPLLMPHIRSIAGTPGAIDVNYLFLMSVVKVRIPVENSGGHLIGRFIRTVGSSIGGQAIITISAIPKEGPDWIISGLVKKP